MSSGVNLSEQACRLLRCPICKSALTLDDGSYVCERPTCGSVFPIVDGIPVLINESNSLFSVSDFTEKRNTTYASPTRTAIVGRFWSALFAMLPELGRNVRSAANYRRLAELLVLEHEKPLVLIVGGHVPGVGMHELESKPNIEVIDSDVTFGPRTRLICDAHDLPFDAGSLDGVVIQAVLEHVVDPYRCVNEIHRVLKDTGLVYAETPFMQQVHGAAYDFTRFTGLGHRRLFRKFEELASGPGGGPAISLAWSWQYFLLSFTSSGWSRAAMVLLGRLSAFWLKYLDPHLMHTPWGLNSSWGFYFLGRKSAETLSDRDLIKSFKGF